MKLSFSTRGWKNTSWQEQLKDAADLHFQGIEFYNIHECEHLMDRNGPFHVYGNEVSPFPAWIHLLISVFLIFLYPQLST